MINSHFHAGIYEDACNAIHWISSQLKKSIGEMTLKQITSNTVDKIKRFIIENWKELLGFGIAWAVIITGMGLMYGFSAVALPLAIGLTCGFAFGILTGVICKAVLEINSKDGSIWGKLNSWFNRLDPNGTRAIVISIVVTVVLAAAVVFPVALGATFGVITGNHLSLVIANDENFGSKRAIVNELDDVKQQIATLDEKMNEIIRKIDNKENIDPKEITDTRNKLTELSNKLKEIEEKAASNNEIRGDDDLEDLKDD